MEMVENPMVIDSLWNDWLSKPYEADPWEKYMDMGEMIGYLDDSGKGAEEMKSFVEYDADDDDLWALWNASNFLRGCETLSGLTKDSNADTIRDYLEANWNDETLWGNLWNDCPNSILTRIAKGCIKAESYRDEYNEKKWREE